MKNFTKLLTLSLIALLLGGNAFGQSNTFPSSGSVGIGTTSPGYKLDVIAPTNTWKARFRGSDGYITIGPANSSWAHIYTDRPNFIFNKPVYSMNGFHSYNSNLNLQAASGKYVQIKPGSSSYGLILREYNSNDFGNIEVTSSGLGLGYNTSGANFIINSYGNIGIGTSANNDGRLVIKQGSTDWISLVSQDSNEKWRITNNDGPNSLTFFYDNGNGGYKFNILELKKDGTVKAGYKFETHEILVSEVEAKEIKSKELTLDIDNVADYVFEEDYKLRSLNDVEKFVKKNKHLPGIPKGSDIENEGMNVAEMSNLLLEKIEELTLYVIGQNKRIEALEAENMKLKAK